MSAITPAQQMEPGPPTPVEPPKLSTNVRWTFLGTVANSLGTWLLVIILARATGAAAVGSYAFVLAVTAPTMAFAGLGVRALLASDATHAYSFREYRSLTLIATALGVLATVLVAAVVGDGGAGWVAVAAILLMRAGDGVSETYFALWQRQERMAVIGQGRVLQSLISVVFVLVATGLGAGVAGAAGGAAAGSTALVAFLHLRTWRDPELHAVARARPAPGSWSRLWAITRRGFPLAVIQFMSAFQAAIPRYFIERYAGKEALGLFASASQLTTSGNTVVGAIGAATLPRLAKWRAAGSRKFWVLARQMVLVGAGLGVAGVLTSLLIGRQVLTLVYRPEFAAAYHVLVVLSLAAGAGFVAQFQGWVLTAASVLAVQPLILGVTLAVLAGCSAVLVPLWGSMGAAWALFASAVVQILASEIVLRGSGRDAPAPAPEGSR